LQRAWLCPQRDSIIILQFDLICQIYFVAITSLAVLYPKAKALGFTTECP